MSKLISTRIEIIEGHRTVVREFLNGEIERRYDLGRGFYLMVWTKKYSRQAQVFGPAAPEWPKNEIETSTGNSLSPFRPYRAILQDAKALLKQIKADQQCSLFPLS